MRPTLIRIRIALTLAATLVALASPAAGQDWTAVWRDPEVVNYELTMERIRKLVAAQRDMTALAAREPDVPAKIDAEMKAMAKNRTAPSTVAGAARMLDRHPSVRDIFAKNGLTARDWLAMSGAMTTAAVDIMLEGRKPASSPRSPAQKANVALLKKNRAEWEKIQKEFARLAAEAEASTAKR
ncbi:MAG: hypothetical protein ACRD2X_23975 [Vicinamibacteraceae bacterium]